MKPAFTFIKDKAAATRRVDAEAKAARQRYESQDPELLRYLPTWKQLAPEDRRKWRDPNYTGNQNT